MLLHISHNQPILHCPAVERDLDKVYQGRWLLLNAQGEIIDANHPKLAQMNLAVKFSYLVIRAPEMLRLDIPLDVIEDDESAFEPITFQGKSYLAVSEGDLAAQWFSVYLGEPTRLMKLHPTQSFV